MTWVPDACTLPTADRPLRVAEFDELLASCLREVIRLRPHRVRLVLSGGADLPDRVRDLTERESACCSFFTFTIGRDAETVLLDVGGRDTGLRRHAAAKLAEIEARIADLTAVADTLRAALDSGCDDLVDCAGRPSCPVPFANVGP